MLFRARFEAGTPPKPIFLKPFWLCVSFILSFAGSFVDVLPLQPLQKVGSTGGSTPKMQICEVNSGPDFRLQIALSLHSEGVLRADFASN